MTERGPRAAVVMPLLADHRMSGAFLLRAIAGLTCQTDSRWRLVIVDDASGRPETDGLLDDLVRRHPDRIAVLRMEERQGPGLCRNTGVRWAAERDLPIVLFHDADDICSPDRVRNSISFLLESDAPCSFLYSPIRVIDERDAPIEDRELPPATKEIVAAHEDPPVGPRAWVDIAVRTGYATVTSTVAVTTALALRHPFPAVRFSEDSHAWLRMTAAGGAAFDPSIPTRYRIARGGDSHAHRDRVGPNANREKLCVDADGFFQALEIGIENGSASRAEAPKLTRLFFERLALSMEHEDEQELASEARHLGRLQAVEVGQFEVT